MSKRRRQKKAPGLPPGALIYTGTHTNIKGHLHWISFDPDQLSENRTGDLSEIPSVPPSGVLWVNMDGIHDVERIEALGKKFDIHPLVLEDVLNIDHRPKAEEYESYLFFTLKMIDMNEQDEIDAEQVSIVLGKNYLVSFQEKPGDIFEPVRDRIRNKKGRVREYKADYLAYLLLDAVVDRYFVILERIALRMEILEDQLVKDTADDSDSLLEIQRLKAQFIELRKAIFPLREAVGYIERCGDDILDKSTLKYFRDLYDHTIQIIDQLEGNREMLSSLQDLYHAMQSNRMNNIMKVLTIMASIFIPLTFIAGIYGMNFDNMPELHLRYGYYVAWAAMIAITLGMLWYFRRKKWM
ncbi:MAG: magnesium/cobalt transporter CorA [Flavobacteriales bacterium]|nr:magnesium/cobalt transporter CorA [Flavobacteriales bacterium]MCB9449288.1 magnesium/cobalt transporter CorA [Flavobacteriales bacterium]